MYYEIKWEEKDGTKQVRRFTKKKEKDIFFYILMGSSNVISKSVEITECNKE